MIQLIGIDVDGTLVGSSGTVDPLVWQAADRARTAGIHLVLCSGRPAFGVSLEYARRLQAGGWHVFQNGASIVNLGSGQSQSAPLPSASVGTFIAQARESDRVLELYSDGAYAVESTSTWAREHAELLGVPFEPRPLESLQGPIVRAQWLVTAAEAQEVMSSAPAGFEVAQSTSPLMPQTRFVGLTRQGVNKGSAIRTIAAELRIDLQNVMYVGDAGNDLSAMRIVGHPVAMGNADPAVQKAARFVVGHVDAGGVAEALDLAVT